MKKNKVLSIAALFILSISCMSCSNKTSEKNLLIPPTAETSEGEKISVPMGGYDVRLDTIPDEYADRICIAFGKKVSEENLNSICFEENIVGVGLASVVYFGKYAENLNDDGIRQPQPYLPKKQESMIK
ncbi:hypothetical protein, partial [Porcipelethomonas sp.]|uniref:hypothetical protein n=1 Tax=Porcipelethomonas sp. TaxID=2981675 RepID=UPI003EFABC07